MVEDKLTNRGLHTTPEFENAKIAQHMRSGKNNANVIGNININHHVIIEALLIRMLTTHLSL